MATNITVEDWDDSIITLWCSYDDNNGIIVHVYYWFDKYLLIDDVFDDDGNSILNIPFPLMKHLMTKINKDFKVIEFVRNWIEDLDDNHEVKQTYMEPWISVMNRMDDDSRPLD